MRKDLFYQRLKHKIPGAKTFSGRTSILVIYCITNVPQTSAYTTQVFISSFL